MPLLPVLLGGIVAAVASQLLTEGEPEPWLALGGMIALVLGAFAASYSLARTSVGAIVRERGSPRSLRRYRIAGKALFFALLGGYWLLLDGGTVAVLARPEAPEVAALEYAAPWLLACLALWAGTFLGEKRALGARTPLWLELRSKLRRVLWPVAVFSVLGLAVNRVSGIPSVREVLDLYPHVRPLAFGALVLGVFASGPLVLRALSPSKPLETFAGSLPLWLGKIANEVRYREWDLGFPVVTASISGLLPRGRTVFVTRALREALEPDELGAVVGHELGHAKLGHLSVRAAFALLLVLVLDDAAALLERAFPRDLVTPLAISGAAILAASGAFVLLARRLEHDADLYSAEGAGSALVIAALSKACGANGGSPERGGLLHPSPRARVALVERAAKEPAMTSRRLAVSRTLVRGVVGLASITVVLVVAEALDDARRPARERLLRAAEVRMEEGDALLARGYVDRALDVGEDARALLLRARTRPADEHAAAFLDLRRATELDPDAATRAAIERARSDLGAISDVPSAPAKSRVAR